MTMLVCLIGWTAFLLALSAWLYERRSYSKMEERWREASEDGRKAYVASMEAKGSWREAIVDLDLAEKRAERAEAVALAMVEGLNKNELLLLSQSKINEGLQKERDEVWQRYEVTTMQLANGQDMLKRQVQSLCLQLQSKGEKPVLMGDVQRMLEEAEKV